MAGKPDFSWIIGGDITQFKKALSDAEKSVQDFGKRNEALFKKLDTLTAPAAAVFAGLALTIGATAKAFGDFEAVLNEIQAVSGATTAEMEKMKAVALDLGAKTKFSAKEAAQGMAELSKAGFTASQAMQAIPGVLSLAAAGGVSVAQAAEAAGAALNGFGLAADDAGKVADIMAKAANLSAVSVGDLQNSLKYIAPIAASTSQSIEEVSTALVIMGNAGIKSEQAGTTIRSALVSLSKPSKDAADVMHRLGVSVQDTQGKMLPLTAILDQLRTKTASMSEVQRANAIATIFGAEAMSGMLAIMKQTPAQVAASAAAVRDYAGAADEMAGVMNQGLNASIEQLGGSIETLGALMGEQFAPSIRLAASLLQGFVDMLSKTPPFLKTLAAAVTVAGVAASGAVLGFAALGAALPVVTAGVGALGLTINTVLPWIGALSLAVGAVTLAVSGFNAETQKTRGQLEGQQSAIGNLTAEYDRLANKVNLTKDEKARLRDVIAKIAQIAPDVVTGYDTMGRAADIDRAAVNRLNESLAEQIRLLRASQLEARQSALAKRDSFRWQMYALEKEITEVESKIGFASSGASTGITTAKDPNSAAMLRRDLETKRALLKSFADSYRQANEEVKRLADPIPTRTSAVTAPVIPGAIVAPGHTDKPSDGGKSAAEKAANEAHQKQVDRIGVLSDAWSRLTRIQMAWGKDFNAEIENQQKLIASLKAEGLDRIEEGQKAILDAQTRITELRGQEAVKAKETADSTAKQAAAAAGEAIRRRQKEAAEQRQKAADEVGLGAAAAQGRVRALSILQQQTEATQAAFHDMAGEITALATDPSLERIANVTKGLMSDPARIESWGKALGSVQGGANAAATGISGVVAALGPLSVVLAAVLASMALVKTAFHTFRPQVLTDALDETRTALTELEMAVEVGLVNPMEKATRESEILRSEFGRLISAKARLKAEMEKPIWDDWTFWTSPGGAVVSKAIGDRIKQAQINAIDAQLPTTGEKLAGAEAKAGETRAFEPGKSMLQQWQEAKQLAQDILTIKREAGVITPFEADEAQLQALQSAYDDLLNKIGQATDTAKEELNAQLGPLTEAIKQQKLQVEANKRRIQDIIDVQERVNQQAQIRSDAEEKIAAAMAKQVDLRKQLADIDKQEREAIAGIQSEGIAIRQKSEVQDKRDRIAAIQADAAERRQAIKEDLERQAKEEAAQRRREEIAAYTQRVFNEGYTGPKPKKAATGGKLAGGISGKDSIPILGMPGELIVDNPTTRALEAFLSAFHQRAIPAPMLAAAGGGGMGPVSFYISGAGQNPEQVARVVWNHIERRARAARIL